MKNNYIAVIDSGFGGLSLLSELAKNFKNEHFLYFGDNDNIPYGNRSNQNLLSLTIKNIDQLKSYGIKALVIACNTLSCTILREIKEYSSFPVFPIFPPVEKEIIKGNKTLLIATENTYNRYKFLTNEKFHCIGLPTMVDHIEKHIFNLSDIDAINIIKDYHKGYFYDKKGWYDRVILGCTHYNFIKTQIINHFQPQKTISGDEDTINNMSKFLIINKSLVNTKGNKVLFIGRNKELNQYIYNKYYNICQK